MNTVAKGLLSARLGLVAFALDAVSAGRDDALLAGLGVPRGVRTVHLDSHRLPDPHQPGRPRAADARRAHRRNPAAAAGSHHRHLRRVSGHVHRQRPRLSLRMVAGTGGGVGGRRRAGRGRARPGDAGDHRKQLRGSQCHGRSGPAAGLHRVVRAGAPSDVHRKCAADARDPVGARVVLGLVPARSRHRRSGAAHSRRGGAADPTNSAATANTPSRCATGYCPTCGERLW